MTTDYKLPRPQDSGASLEALDQEGHGSVQKASRAQCRIMQELARIPAWAFTKFTKLSLCVKFGRSFCDVKSEICHEDFGDCHEKGLCKVVQPATNSAFRLFFQVITSL